MILSPVTSPLMGDNLSKGRLPVEEIDRIYMERMKANCGGASTSSFTCLQNLDMRDKPQDKAAESEPKHVTRVKKYIGEVDLPESRYLDLSSHSSHVSFAMARRYGTPPTGKQTPFRALPHPVP